MLRQIQKSDDTDNETNAETKILHLTLHFLQYHV